MDEVLERLAVLEAKEAIRDCLYRYCRGVDRCDLDMLKSVYHADAIDVHGATYAGNAHKFAEWIVPAMSKALVNRHQITNPMIQLEGKRAFVESQWVSTHRVAIDEERAAEVHSEGRYIDVFEERDGEWKIFHRLVVGEKMRLYEAKVAGTAPESNGIRATVGDHDDPVFLGFDIVKVSPEPYEGNDPMVWLASVFA